ncbi:ATP-binding cassette domain-containing protein [Chelativorans sp. J32]|uniref:ATP-binding cassette domain-containing protein n=1 Tax=Chelativorans sp. J32 TaxID=935840 RepID=UPI000481B651|nr:ATP-binding cassette domain-containing protein [Chelativorans sp. J32]
MDNRAGPLLRVENLSVHFPVRTGLLGRSRRLVRALNNVDLTLEKGECLSVVGESGCGKSTLAFSIVGLQTPTSGSIHFEGRAITGKAQPSRIERARMAQIVFQDPYASLNPRQTVLTSLAAPLRLQGIVNNGEVEGRVMEMMRLVGLSPDKAKCFPHEFSGGQRQRIGIARALILSPKVVVLDEPVSALDVSIRAQIINLLLDLKERLELSYIMISHDLSVVEHMSNRVAVMYFGQVVEEGRWDRIFGNPAHPYTRRLIAAIPDPFAAFTTPSLIDEAGAQGPPHGFDYHPREFGTHDIYSDPPASQLVSIGDDHRVRLVPAAA